MTGHEAAARHQRRAVPAGGPPRRTASRRRVLVSVITELELLSYPSLTVHERFQIDRFLRDVSIVELTQNIKEGVIKLRREHRLKLPDAIIAATALWENADLLTNDERLHRVPVLRWSAVRLKDE
jgi:predicted nucleic acid-binding protein